MPKEEELELGGAAGLPQAEVRSPWKEWTWPAWLVSYCKLRPRGSQL